MVVCQVNDGSNPSDHVMSNILPETIELGVVNEETVEFKIKGVGTSTDSYSEYVDEYNASVSVEVPKDRAEDMTELYN